MQKEFESDISLCSGNGREQHGKRWRRGGGDCSLLVAGEREGRREGIKTISSLVLLL